MSEERDTKFAGFARAVIDELVSKSPSEWGYDEACLLIARRAYDLVEHATKELLASAWFADWMLYVPDLPELPEDDE